MTHRLEAEKLLCDLVDIESVTGREQRVMQFLGEKLKDLGARTTQYDMGNGRYNLLGSIGSGRPILCLNAHADTMPPIGRSVPKASARDGIVHGLGSCDDKASVTSMLLAYSQLSRVELCGRLDLLISVDEEVSSRGVRTCVEEGYGCDYAVVGEPTGLCPIVAHSGIIFLELVASGVAGHGSSPWEGKNAILAMIDLCRDIDGLVAGFPPHALVGRPSTNLGTISGGDATNRVPTRCEARVDVRVVPGTEVSEVLESIKMAVDQRGASFSVYKTGDPFEADRESRLLTTILKVEGDVLGEAMEPRGSRVWTEADPFRNLAGADTIVIGPGEVSRAHTEDECVDLSQVREAAEIYQGVALGILGRD